ncbi:MAG: SpaA isopeptide-forming pilin-related protein, partial [Clostridium sp.]|uniref:SpaA isopeptide-forming pilin-related protein n=1 Tax=Clostridium sp. TaxID=1506 RepID=UPI003F3C8403
LQGAEFTITKPDGTKVKVTTNDKGIAELSGLAWGEYTVQETAAPQGYDLDNTVHKIIIDNNNANVVQSLNVVDGAKTGTIKVTKLGKDGVKLVGAQFTITAPGKEPVVITTDINGVAEATGLPWGTYTIKETKAPKGYTLSDKVNTVDITKDNVSTIQNVTVNDTQILGKLQVTKTGNNGEKLANAEFKITGPNGFHKTITTDKNGVASLDNLAWGDYTVKEIKAPVGYTLNSTVQKVTIGADNVENIQSVNVVDTQILGQLQIVKTDATSNKALAGATFKVTGPNGFDKTVTTDKDGQVNLDNLAWGKYVVKETAAPNGYNLDKTPQEITVGDTSVGKVQVAKFADSRVLGNIKITKTNEKGQTLQGAEFTITKPDGTKVK